MDERKNVINESNFSNEYDNEIIKIRFHGHKINNLKRYGIFHKSKKGKSLWVSRKNPFLPSTTFN